MKPVAQQTTGSSQSALILAHLQAGGTLTPMDALNLFKCWSLSQRITDLRQQGHRIVTTRVDDALTGKHYARYHLERTDGAT
jgi:Helix-turn-helix domain